MRDLEKEGAAHRAMADEAAQKVERQTEVAAAQVQGSMAHEHAERLLGQMRQNAAIAATNRSLFAEEISDAPAPGPAPSPPSSTVPLRAPRKTRPITALQRHVLDHLDRVELWPFKLQVLSPRRRYTLDGKDCTPQVTSLAVRGAVRVRDGRLERTGKAED